MKTFQTPDAITLTDHESGEEGARVTFSKFVRLALLSDQKFGSDYEGVSAALRISDALKSPVVKLSVSDWERLRDVAKKPSAGAYQGFHPLALIQLTPFLDAIIGAGDAKE